MHLCLRKIVYDNPGQIVRIAVAAVLLLSGPLATSPVHAQAASDDENQSPLDGRDGRELLLRNFRPHSKLRVAQHPRAQARYAVVDVHTHFHHRLHGNEPALDDFVALMDRNRVAVCASLDGKLGGQLEQHRKYLWKKYRDRFVIFANVDWIGDGERDDPGSWQCHQHGFAERTANQLAAAVADGTVSGLKVFKQFGLRYCAIPTAR